MQADHDAQFTAVNIRLTFPSHGSPSLWRATLPVSEKPAASDKCWYLLSSVGSPRPRADHGLRAGGTAAPSGHDRRSAGYRTRARVQLHTTDPRPRPFNPAATASSQAYARLHVNATRPGHHSYWLLSLAREDPHHEGLTQALARGPVPPGASSFWAPRRRDAPGSFIFRRPRPSTLPKYRAMTGARAPCSLDHRRIVRSPGGIQAPGTSLT